jgi:hypothetical protein
MTQQQAGPAHSPFLFPQANLSQDEASSATGPSRQARFGGLGGTSSPVVGDKRPGALFAKGSIAAMSCCRRDFGRFIRRVALAVGLMVVSMACLSIALMGPARTNPFPSWEIALALADRGAEETIRQLEQDERKSEGTSRSRERVFFLDGKTLGKAGGSCYVTVTEPDRCTRLIDATGIVHDRFHTLAQRSVRVTMRRTFLFEEALFAREGFFLDEELETCGHDVEQPGDGAPMGKSGRCMENVTDGEMEGQPVVVRGNVTQQTGTGSHGRSHEGGVQQNPHASGAVGGVGGGRDLPLVLPPWGLPPLEGIVLSGGDGLTLSRSGCCPFIAVGDGANLVIDSDVDISVTGTLAVTRGGRLIIAEGVTKVCFYVGADVLLEREAAVVNLTGRAASFSIWGMERRSSICIDSSEPFRGTIYAPDSEIRLGPNTRVFGAVYGRTVRLSRGARVHYDDSLRSIRFLSPRFAVVSRHEL